MSLIIAVKGCGGRCENNMSDASVASEDKFYTLRPAS